MTLTVSLKRVGIVSATTMLHQACNDAARRHQMEIRTGSVAVERAGPEAPNSAASSTCVFEPFACPMGSPRWRPRR